ncbi:hypothetical protein LCGC14_1129830 [marine sediment metagenome]|uniref:Uncharacterized protein n=1 Tax=marine sediment metagenome TaxID=412755 RepID=A0A0F9M683_9ZZZZ
MPSDHDQIPATRCAFCREPVDIETCLRDHAFFYCSPNCKLGRERAYDKYVDPLGRHSNPDRIATHD